MDAEVRWQGPTQNVVLRFIHHFVQLCLSLVVHNSIKVLKPEKVIQVHTTDVIGYFCVVQTQVQWLLWI